MEREIERLDSMISQVLKLARLHGANARIEKESFELDEVIEEVVRDANFEGAVKHCTVKVQGSAKAAILGNRELLRSAIENVLRNAVRYSPIKTAVDLSIARLRSGLEIAITDHGPGVPPAELERIFEPFYRVAESRDRDSGGEGIGLAITAEVMKAHGGSARARNTPGGFEVLLSLPDSTLAV
jgi:two-component system sensor histidine kinase CpxA